MSRRIQWFLVAACAACAATWLAACGKTGPHWAKRADQIDRAAWVAACGRAATAFNDDDSISEAFSTEPERGSTSRLYINCSFDHYKASQRLWYISIEVMAPANELTPQLRDSLRRLVEDVVPEAVRATIREGAASPTMLSRWTHGFWIQVGFYGSLPDTLEWRLAVRSDL